MDMYQAVMSENRLLEESIKKLVDTTSAEARLRTVLLVEIKARFDALESVKEQYIYPYRRTAVNESGLAEQYQTRADAIRTSVHQLYDIPPDATDVYQNQTEILLKELSDLLQWERREAHPALQKLFDDETAAEIGDQMRLQEKNLFRRQSENT